MRIIAGRFKGHHLPSPRNKGVRPTTDRVREALFSALGTTVIGSHVLDLFAGTGAFGFEALSRGAEAVVFVDNDRRVTGRLADTAGSLDVQDRVVIFSLDALEAVSKLADQGRKFEIVFLDPPYESDWIHRVVSTSTFCDLFGTEATLIIERSARLDKPQIPEIFHEHFGRNYGDTMVEIFHTG
jgi:16S rRNA (guanine(966)-N(2))-methyltransferase RsmD